MSTMPRRTWFSVAAGTVAASVVVPAARASERSAAGLTFEIYEDAKKEFRWRLKAANGQVIATSGQGYKAKADCRHGIEVIQKEAAAARVEEAKTKD
jgi:uncharacterized protein YegP (UPF0339 family)